jgi:adenosylcobinamide-GDP ribazoletransferase
VIRPFLIATQFLTRLPVRLDAVPDDKDVGRSLIYYPLIGVLIGVLLVVFALVLNGAPTLLGAALVLALWVLLTGGLHLDGLADSADAWVGGLGNREKTLAIMKDPYCGPAGVVSIVLVLLIKFTALYALIETENLLALLLAPTLGRTLLPLLFLMTPYVRDQGLGFILAACLPRRAIAWVIAATIAVVFFLEGSNGLWLVLTVILVFTVLRNMMLRRIGGMTGDTAGALVEISEATVLVSATLIY